MTYHYQVRAQILGAHHHLLVQVLPEGIWQLKVMGRRVPILSCIWAVAAVAAAAVAAGGVMHPAAMVTAAVAVVAEPELLVVAQSVSTPTLLCCQVLSTLVMFRALTGPVAEAVEVTILAALAEPVARITPLRAVLARWAVRHGRAVTYLSSKTEAQATVVVVGPVAAQL